ncbi:MAG: glycogen-binding domain-containing protein [Candidatus Eisenbacteria sp.]|nr:glycogen-binding domain-containing protein [Candidatus Eisenbacteria bacterium]
MKTPQRHPSDRRIHGAGRWPLRRWGDLLMAAGMGILLGASMASAAPPDATEEGIRFTYVDATARQVYLAGSFNDWSTTAAQMTRAGDTWSVTVALEAGEYEYKFIVDGQWIGDPDNPVTVGDYGNSAVTVAAGGTLQQMRATSNTALSPKMWISGRAIGLYISEKMESREGRYELQRPSLDVDIDFQIRINEDLQAHILTNISNEAENVEFYETRLNFDRGSLTLDNPTINVKAWDNEAIGTWDDPLHLVGDVGIYHHQYGYETVGARIRKQFYGVEGEVFYSDDFATGGSEHPSIDADLIVTPENTLITGEDSLGFSRGRILHYMWNNTDNAMDVLGLRLKRPFDFRGRHWRVGVSYRLNRGFNSGALTIFEVDPADTTRSRGKLYEYGSSFERMQAYGGDLLFEPAEGFTITAEYLYGRVAIESFSGTITDAELTSTSVGDSLIGSITRLTDGEEIGEISLDLELDCSRRAWLGLDWERGLLGARWSASWEYQKHDLDPLATKADVTIENRASIWRGEFRPRAFHCPLSGRRMEAGVSLEYHDFDYDENAPWDTQFWFDTRNFWLENGEHEVSFERMTLLGGRDALLWRPEVSVVLNERRDADFRYRATLGGEGFDRKPKYFESIFQLGTDVGTEWRLSIDTRLARYDDPVLDLHDTFRCSFVELAYAPAEGVELSLGYGVAPYVIDDPVNEYAYVGRDAFLFAEGAHAGLTETNFRNLGRLIQRAEQALEEERRIQLQAVLRF